MNIWIGGGLEEEQTGHLRMQTDAEDRVRLCLPLMGTAQRGKKSIKFNQIISLSVSPPAGPGHVVHPVHRLHAARDSGEAAEEPEHGPQLQAALPPSGSAGSAQLLPALQAAGHRR